MESFLDILTKNGVIDNERRWAAGDATLVQMGDVLDGKSRAVHQFVSEYTDVDVLKFLESLRRQARYFGGDVRCLLGNHEIMNMMHIFDYVAPADRASRDKMAPIVALIRNLCEPLFIIDRNLFCHAGISPENYANTGATALLTAASGSNSADLAKTIHLGGEEGITMSRYYMDASAQDYDAVSKVLEGLACDRMFIGHNHVSKRITTRCRGRVVLTDTGISRAFSVESGSEMVVIEDGRAYALLDGIERPI